MESKLRYIVSGCLAGLNCRYDGRTKPCAPIVELYKKGEALPICPERLSGMASPRPPCERLGDRFINSNGEDMTEFLKNGAKMAMDLANASGCRKAILKTRSPSCGLDEIYDGTFRKRLRTGMGIWAELLLEAGFEIFTEENLPNDVKQGENF